jgi:polyisoprenyl-phosphate glycosyltransferase
MECPVEISVVAPLFNESAVIFELHSRLKHTLEQICSRYEIIFVNDGSIDDTAAKVKQLAKMFPEVRYIGLSRNFGHQIAVSAGLEHSCGRAVVIIDGDLQDPPELIETLYAKFKEGYKIVHATRKNREGETFLKKLTAKLFYRILALITEIEIPLDTGDFRIIDRVVVEKLMSMPENNKFLRGQMAWLGFKSTSVAFDRLKRQSGKTGYTYRKMIRFAMDGITAFSNFPLKIATFFGVVFSGVAFLTICYALYSKYILHSAIRGWASLIVSSMLIGGVQLICIGIIGEYINRIYIDVRRRPLYVMEETENLNQPDGS